MVPLWPRGVWAGRQYRPPTPGFLRTPACEPRIHTLPDVPQQPPPPPPVPAKKTRPPQPARWGSGEIIYQSDQLSGLALQGPQGMCLWWEPEAKLGRTSRPAQRPHTRAFPTRGFDTLSEATDLGFSARIVQLICRKSHL